DRLALAVQRRTPAADDEERRRDERVPDPRHQWLLSLLPITMHTATRATAAMNHVTCPSGTGPRCPSAQPPRSSGCFAYWTYAMIESSWRSEICFFEKR